MKKYSIGLFILFTSCLTDPFQREAAVLSEFKISTEVKYVVIVPVEGCTSCVNEGLKFGERNSNNPNVIVILTDNKSEKSTKLKAGEMLTGKSVILDSENKFVEAGLVQYNPLIFYLSSGKIQKVIATSFETTNLELNLLE